MTGVEFWFRVLKRAILKPTQSLRAWRVIMKLSKEIESTGVKVILYDRLAVHNTFMAPIARCLDKSRCPFVYLVSDPSHPLIGSNDTNVSVHFLPPGFELFTKFIRVPYILTAASNVESSGKNRRTKWIHTFHSPVSLHFVYKDTALDAYDIFFCVGPHQKKELELLGSHRRWGKVEVFELGYPKLDEIVRLAKTSQAHRDNEEPRKIAFAPSWGKENVLRSHGHEIVRELLKGGFRVTVRPHKHSFDFDVDILSAMRNEFAAEHFSIDDSPGFEGIIDCDLLISDWSGVAYEFAFSTGRPVIFVEVNGGRKVQSETNRAIPVDAMEDICRHEVGLVCRPEEIVGAVLAVLDTDLGEWYRRIEAVRDKYFYNFGAASDPVARKMVELAQTR